MTFDEIEYRWQQTRTQEQYRGIWEALRGTPQGWLTACQAAVTGRDLQTIERWLEVATSVETGTKIGAGSGAKEACLTFANGAYAPIARAYLLCAQALLQPMSGGLSTPVPESAIQSLAAQMPTLGWPPNQWRDVCYIIRPSGLRAQAPHSVTIPVLLAHLSPQQQVRGVVAHLMLDLRLYGNRTIYP